MADEIVAPRIKRCKGCGKEFSETREFFEWRGVRFRATCRACRREGAVKRAALYRQRHHDEARERERAAYWDNPEHARAKVAAYRAKHPERVKAAKDIVHDREKAARRARGPIPRKSYVPPLKKTCKACGETKPRTREFFALDKNGVCQSALCRKCRAAKVSATHRDRSKEAARKKARRRANAGVRLSDSISSQIRIALRSKKAGLRWERIVGYSIDQLRNHLERQFARGMSWENYGTRWQVDHIVPVAFFRNDMSVGSARACWALSNLRPLWAHENIVKQAKRIFLI